MKLYHFTLDTHLESILQVGLRALPLRCGGMDEDIVVKLQRGVWLTECEDTRMSPEAIAGQYKVNGVWFKHWLFDRVTPERVVRLTVNIGDNDRRLVRFSGGAYTPHLDEYSARHWMYLRAITPDKITDVDLEARHAEPKAVSA